MNRIKIKLPEQELGVVEIPVRITDLNYGNHLGNDSLVSILHEARVRWLQAKGYSELDIEGSSIILAGLMVEFTAESFYGDILRITLLAGSLSRCGFELFYRVECLRNDKIIQVARAKTELVFFDYKKRRVLPLPEAFGRLLSGH